MNHLPLEEQIAAAIQAGDRDSIVLALEGHAPTGDGHRAPAAVRRAYATARAAAAALVDQEKLRRQH